jgi:hypothetical protein
MVGYRSIPFSEQIHKFPGTLNIIIPPTTMIQECSEFGNIRLQLTEANTIEINEL